MPKLIWVVLMFVAIAPTTSLLAQTDQPLNRDARDIFETVMSPYCPGRTISNCPSPQADELRATIKQQLAAGETPEDIKEELYAVFGDELRTVPRARGFGLLAWIVPGLGFLAGGWAIVSWMRRTGAYRLEAARSASVELDAESDARLKAAMAELESHN